ncbi:MAG TPA: GNAT family N-acetyltransferase [Anaerolineae bacterium]|nr:GNAT family N-acetyltransferase [Anaerolineae bacterium]HID83769.1 GNAT family N-acetyltransferase [Anaerolineales bacterium]HIQ09610.1 GNAT family N-acetyltransferase [Anaerolineaceae bacterium]
MRFHSRPFRPEGQERVRALVLEGLAEHWGVLDPTANPDLENVAAAYRQGCFLVVWQDGEIVGTGALLPRGGHIVEIVRGSVRREWRRRGIGKALLHALCREAQRRGVRQLVLETTATWHDAIAFDRALGFKETRHADGNMYFALPVNACTRWD